MQSVHETYDLDREWEEEAMAHVAVDVVFRIVASRVTNRAERRHPLRKKLLQVDGCDIRKTAFSSAVCGPTRNRHQKPKPGFSWYLSPARVHGHTTVICAGEITRELPLPSVHGYAE